MTRLIAAVCAAGAIHLAAPAGAEDLQDIPPPSAPILRRAPDASEWTVTFHKDRAKAMEDLAKSKEEEEARAKDPESDRVSASPGQLDPVEVTVTKQGGMYREITAWPGGKKTEKWITGKLQVIESEINGSVSRVMIPRIFFSPDYSDYSRSDFEKCEWVAMDNYVGVRKMNGLPVYAFELPVEKKPLTPREKAEARQLADNGETFGGRLPATLRVYLDIKTQLPLLCDDGSILQIYRYNSQRPGPLTLPPKFAAVLADWQEEIARKTRVPTPP